MVKWTVWFYNLRVGRNQDQVDREIHALLAKRPEVLGLCEAVGYDFPRVHGYRLIRDRSAESRANIAAYVRSDLTVRKERWLDLKQTWNRTDHPGKHPPRSILVMLVDGVQVLVVHVPPRGTSNVVPAQQECIDALTAAMAPWRGLKVWHQFAKLRPRIAIGDFNRRAVESGPSPRTLADRIGGAVANGRRIDTAVVRRVDVDGVAYPHKVDGVVLESDHNHALCLNLLLPRI